MNVAARNKQRKVLALVGPIGNTLLSKYCYWYWERFPRLLLPSLINSMTPSPSIFCPPDAQQTAGSWDYTDEQTVQLTGHEALASWRATMCVNSKCKRLSLVTPVISRITNTRHEHEGVLFVGWRHGAVIDESLGLCFWVLRTLFYHVSSSSSSSSDTSRSITGDDSRSVTGDGSGSITNDDRFTLQLESSKRRLVVTLLTVCLCVLWSPVFSWQHSFTLRRFHTTHTFKITFECTQDMSYANSLYLTELSSLQHRRQQQARDFFRSLLDPNSCLHSLLPTPRDPNLVTRLRATRRFPALASRTKKIPVFYKFWPLNYQ